MPVNLIEEIRACRICESQLPLGPRPVFSIHQEARVIIVGQAPGTRVHASGIPWDDQSGRRLRHWMGVDDVAFYDPRRFAIVPMGFCYPGKGKSGDLPPRPECAPQWHARLLAFMPGIELFLLIGQYAQNYYLRERKKKNLTLTVKAYREYLPQYLPLPHPSPRNQLWLRRNPWFEEELVPLLQEKLRSLKL